MRVDTRHVSVKNGDVIVLAGTAKGLFLLRSNAARSRWDLAGPYHAGHSVYTAAYDQRGGRRRVWAAPGSDHWGYILSTSDDFGRHWTTPESAPIKFPEDTGATLKRIWQIRPGRPTSRERCTAASSPRRCSNRATAESPGRWCAGSGIIRTAKSGSRAAAGSACTPFCPTPRVAGA